MELSQHNLENNVMGHPVVPCIFQNWSRWTISNFKVIIIFANPTRLMIKCLLSVTCNLRNLWVITTRKVSWDSSTSNLNVICLAGDSGGKWWRKSPRVRQGAASAPTSYQCDIRAAAAAGLQHIELDTLREIHHQGQPHFRYLWLRMEKNDYHPSRWVFSPKISLD